jgi:hypothetical protein
VPNDVSSHADRSGRVRRGYYRLRWRGGASELYSVGFAETDGAAVRRRKRSIAMLSGAVASGVAMVAWTGCERSDAPTPAPTPTPAPPVAESSVIVEFPDELQAKDASVAAFIREVIKTCVEGDYDQFRLLWSAKEDPFPRDAFERGWRAVRRVRIMDIQKFRRPVEDDLVFGVHAHVELDESVPERSPDVVLLIVKEAGRWRLAEAPPALRERFLGPTDELPAAAPEVTTQPVASEDSH